LIGEFSSDIPGIFLRGLKERGLYWFISIFRSQEVQGHSSTYPWCYKQIQRASTLAHGSYCNCVQSVRRFHGWRLGISPKNGLYRKWVSSITFKLSSAFQLD
jgi:hypothetical protein